MFFTLKLGRNSNFGVINLYSHLTLVGGTEMALDTLINGCVN